MYSQKRHIKTTPVTFEEFESIVEKAHGHNKYAKSLWSNGFVSQYPNPKILDIPSPFWCFIAMERPIAVANEKIANQTLGKFTLPGEPN